MHRSGLRLELLAQVAFYVEVLLALGAERARHLIDLGPNRCLSPLGFVKFALAIFELGAQHRQLLFQGAGAFVRPGALGRFLLG